MSSPVLIEQLDSAIEVLLADPDMAIANVDPAIAELLGVAAELRTLPRPDFRLQLRAGLMGRAFAPSASTPSELCECPWRPLIAPHAPRVQERILPTLLGDRYETYAVRRSNFAVSIVAHAAALFLLVACTVVVGTKQARVQAISLVLPRVSEYLPIANSATEPGGGGGGGDRGKALAAQGHLPKMSMKQITPPEVAVRNQHPEPKLEAEPTIIMPPINIASSHLPNLGDPKSSIVGPPSNGPGSGAGFGTNKGGGIGSGDGSGFGPGFGGGFSGGVFRVGGGVSAPRVIYKPDPEYSPEARQAKYQGTVVLSLIVAPDGKAHAVRVARSLGMGLDERAIDAVRQWRFEPAMKDGKPVSVAVDVEVNFRLF